MRRYSVVVYTLAMPSNSLALWKKEFSSSSGVSPCLANSMGFTISQWLSFGSQTLASGISSKLRRGLYIDH